MKRMPENTKQVRVDNWGIFFLQRLQLFFSKTDYCDMTLQFEGNVQLKVHRLVMNACTDYFQFLEQTCTTMENVVMMPADLQADVIVPIVNFMYTGMLEFQLSIFDRLYKTAQVMNITILTKLLDAQKKQSGSSSGSKIPKKKVSEPTPTYSAPVKKVSVSMKDPDLPATLPGRKLPVWKRKTLPASASQIHTRNVSPLCYSEPKWLCSTVDPLSIPDNTPKPTRFEWPDDDLPVMDNNFEDISYTSKPLMTKADATRASTSFDHIKDTPDSTPSTSGGKKSGNSSSMDMEEMQNYVKEQQIRCGLSSADEEYVDNDLESIDTPSGTKRKLEVKMKGSAKKVRFEDNEKSPTISISGSAGELDHNKIVSEILKKYPQLVKKNKNIRLKIMAKSKAAPVEQPKVESVLKSPRITRSQVGEAPKRQTKVVKSREPESRGDNKGPWVCACCSSADENMEFVLYYLYRKHMTEVHNEKFDPLLCKYCGHRCHSQNLLMYHLYTKHGMKPPTSHNFPKCTLCPFIALSSQRLNKHKLRHQRNEVLCEDCKLAFTSPATLTAHMQITGHTGKGNKSNFDCQYCTKRYTSGVNLFSHVRLKHKNDAIRDGIVSMDENDDLEQFEEEFDEDSCKDEYILPEIMSEQSPSKKVNILQNVKVQDRHQQQHSIALEPSSEAEALNNVASGIATSLGLVDIVVLNDNQQIFLHPDQQGYDTESSERSEFILPELTDSNTFGQSRDEVITSDGVITQSMLSGGDIGSTDELVMVLTDHDYGDNQEEISSENSNIVVLYSHPVDGQQDQFVTSQGNIMVNPETGLIEIRNGATITTSSANQVVMTPQEGQIESIEMIQREINSHVDLKTENIYEEDTKPIIVHQESQHEEEEQQQQDDEEMVSCPPESQLLESLVQAHVDNEIEQENQRQEIEQQPMEVEENQEIVQNISNEEEQQVQQDNNVEESSTNVDDFVSLESEKMPENGANESIMVEEASSVPVDNQVEETETPKEAEPEIPPAIDENKDDEETEQVSSVEVVEGAAVIENVEINETEVTESTVVTEADEVVGDPLKETVQENENVPEETQENQEEDNNTSFLTTDGNEEVSEVPLDEPQFPELPTAETNDEHSQTSQEFTEETRTEETEDKDNHATKISILDDWEDTDSQQSSDPKEKQEEQVVKAVGETVDKLMDDWVEEDEEPE